MCVHRGITAYIVYGAHSSPNSQHLTGLKARLSGQSGAPSSSASFSLLIMDYVYSVYISYPSLFCPMHFLTDTTSSTCAVRLLYPLCWVLGNKDKATGYRTELFFFLARYPSVRLRTVCAATKRVDSSAVLFLRFLLQLLPGLFPLSEWRWLILRFGEVELISLRKYAMVLMLMREKLASLWKPCRTQCIIWAHYQQLKGSLLWISDKEDIWKTFSHI